MVELVDTQDLKSCNHCDCTGSSPVRGTYLFRERKKIGAIAQLVEQRTENPCVPGSIPGGTTQNKILAFDESQDFLLFKDY